MEVHGLSVEEGEGVNGWLLALELGEEVSRWQVEVGEGVSRWCNSSSAAEHEITHFCCSLLFLEA